jgi:hypothetical protein
VCEALEKMTAFFQQALGLDWVSLQAVRHAFGALKVQVQNFYQNLHSKGSFHIIILNMMG